MPRPAGSVFQRQLPSLTPEQLDELVRRYWQSDEPRKDIEASFRLSSGDFSALMPPLPAGTTCPHCGAGMVWRSRQARDRHEAWCRSCRHRSGYCTCEPCEQEAEAAERTQREHAIATWISEYGSDEYAVWALRHLTGPQRLFLDAARELWSESFLTWDAIAAHAGVQRRWVHLYSQRLQTLRLIFHDGSEFHLHPELATGRVRILAATSG
jgi:hypothetical protein